MLLTLSILGILLSVILMYFNARKYTSSIYLGAFFFLVSFYGLIQYVLLYSKSVFLVSIIFVNVGFPTYFIGPLLYFYVRSVLTDNSRLKKWDFLHLLPMLVYLAGIFPYLVSSWDHKMEAARHLVENTFIIEPTSAVSMYRYVSVGLVYLSRPVLVMGYLLWSAGMIIQFFRSKNESLVFFNQRFMKKWLMVLLGFLFVLVLSHILSIIHIFAIRSTNIFYTLSYLQIISGIGLAGLLISPFFFPDILYGLPKFPDTVELNRGKIMTNEPLPTDEGILSSEKAGNPLTESVPLPSENRSLASKFEADYLALIGTSTGQCMNDFKPYLQQDFNMAQLSVLVNIPVHHLAYYFREVKQMSFTDFRNRWRIEHAKKLIFEGKSNELTLEAIGLLSGFSSRNTFLLAFKKAEGISPQVFLSQIKKK